MDASPGTGGHSVRTGGGVRVHRRAVAADVRVAADVDAVRTDADGHRRVHAARLLPVAPLLAARILAAARAGILAAVLLATAIVRPEQAATRESRRERPGRDRNLNRLRDDLVHSAPPFCFAGEPISPDAAHYELFRFRCMLEKQRKSNLAKKARHFCRAE